MSLHYARKLLYPTLVCAVVTFAAIGCKKGPDASVGKGQLTIAVIPKGTSHLFWKTVEAGAQQAADEHGVKLIWKGPVREDDKSQQVDIVDQFVSDNVSGICVAPLDSTALLSPVQSAGEKKIPVVVFDSALNGQVGKDFASFVATDNKKGGQIAGAELARLLNDKGKVVLLRYAEGSASTEARESGFLDEIKTHPGLEVIQENRYGGATASESQIAAENLVDKLKQADGIFCPNESSTQGMLKALEENGLAGKVKFVGFDASPILVDALRKNEIQALVSQDPRKMGYEAVSTIVKVIKGETVSPYIDTGVKLVTPQNIDDPDIKKLIGG